jgi:hypothetical protein
MKQPLLCIKTKNPDQEYIYLIPEHTIMTGFTDEMRSNYTTMVTHFSNFSQVLEKNCNGNSVTT